MSGTFILKIDAKGRLTLPSRMRKAFHINPGDGFLVKPEKTGIHLVKAEGSFDELAEYARHERETGKSVELRAFAKKHKIPVKK